MKYLFSIVIFGFCFALRAQDISINRGKFISHIPPEIDFSIELNRRGASGGVTLPGPILSWESDTGVTGSPASAWTNLTGTLALTQGTAGSRPAVTASAFGSTTGLTFDGVNDVLSYTGLAVTNTGSATLSVVFKTSATVTGPVVLVSQSDSSAVNDWWEFGIAADGKLYVERNAIGTKLTVEGSTVLDASTVYNAILTFDGTDYWLSLNGVEENPLVITNIGTFAWLGGVGGTRAFSVGATVISGSTVRFFSGVIGAIYFWDRDITG